MDRLGSVVEPLSSVVICLTSTGLRRLCNFLMIVLVVVPFVNFMLTMIKYYSFIKFCSICAEYLRSSCVTHLLMALAEVCLTIVVPLYFLNYGSVPSSASIQPLYTCTVSMYSTHFHNSIRMQWRLQHCSWPPRLRRCLAN